MKNKYTSSQIRDILKWDYENWKHAIYYFDEHIDFESIDSCLEIGARSGGLSLWLALHGKTNIVCSDYVDNSLIASEMHRNYNVSATYKVIDATSINEKEKYDLICFKSVLGGIGCNDNKAAQYQAIQEMYSALKPGGVLVFAENLVGTSFHMYLRNHFRKIDWRYLNLEELKDMTSIFSDVQFITYGFLGTLGRNEWQRYILSKLDTLINIVIPNKKKYIAFFICRK